MSTDEIKTLNYLKKKSGSKTAMDLLKYLEGLTGKMRQEVRKEVYGKSKSEFSAEVAYESELIKEK